MHFGPYTHKPPTSVTCEHSHVVTVSMITNLFFIPLQRDLPHRQVDQMEIENLYKEHNFIGWTEISAKDGLMVNDSMK